MIEISEIDVFGEKAAFRGMRNPMNSWAKSDSRIAPCGYRTRGGSLSTPRSSFDLGDDDRDLAIRLANAGRDHAKFRRMLVVSMDIIAPLYWWKEFDTYKVGTVANSCSTMHKIHAKKFERDDFSHEFLLGCNGAYSTETLLQTICDMLNHYRTLYLEESDPAKKKIYWWQMIQLLPASYNQRRTVMLNYEVLANIHHARRNHKLDEWHTFCDMIEELPYSELITGKVLRHGRGAPISRADHRGENDD